MGLSAGAGCANETANKRQDAFVILGEKFLSNVMNTRYFTTPWAPENPQSINALINNAVDWDRKTYYESGTPSLAGLCSITASLGQSDEILAMHLKKDFCRV